LNGNLLTINVIVLLKILINLRNKFTLPLVFHAWLVAVPVSVNSGQEVDSETCSKTSFFVQANMETFLLLLLL